MTNPDNIVRVRARNGGRASVYEANGWCQAFSTGLLEGNGVIQNTVADMNVLVGGSITKPDVVIATNPAGYKIALDIVGQQAVAITAPASNKRISAIVAYTDDLSLPTTQDTVTGAPGSCGLIVVNGTAASSPTAPNDTTIRSAITADGATGSQASYCVIATVLVENGTTAITSSEITTNKAGVTSQNIDCATSVDADGWIKVKLANNAVMYAKQGSFSITMGGSTWTSRQVSAKPTDLDIYQTFRGIVSGTSGDKAINVCGLVDFGNGKVEIQTQNVYTGSVSSDIYWQAHIIQTL